MGRADFKTDSDWYKSNEYRDGLHRCCDGMDWLYKYEFDDVEITFVLYMNEFTGLDTTRTETIYIHDHESHKGELLTTYRWRK